MALPVDKLQAERAAVAGELERLRALPEAERIGPRGGRSGYRDRVAGAEGSLVALDKLLAQATRDTKRTRRGAKCRVPGEPQFEAFVPQPRAREVRVTVRPSHNRPTVELTAWIQRGGAMVATRNCILIDGPLLDTLIDALKTARQHV